MKPRVPRMRSRQRTNRNGCAAISLLALLASGNAWAEAAPVPDLTMLSVNGDAHQQVTISGVMPTTLAVRLFATYQSTTPYTRNPCGRWLKGASASVPIGVTIPLDVAQRGGYEATALVDKFEPRKCGWHFYGISFTVNGVGSGISLHSMLIAYPREISTPNDGVEITFRDSGKVLLA
jgi:hypothetical protein